MADFREVILVVDDEEKVVRSMKAALEEIAPVIGFTNPIEALKAMGEHEVAVAIVDQRLPEMSGADLLAAIRKQSPRTRRFVLTGYEDLGALVKAINEGQVHLYIDKPWNLEQLRRHVVLGLKVYQESVKGADALAHFQARSSSLEAENIELKTRLRTLSLQDEILTDNPEMRRVLNVSESVGRVTDIVLICGESGTGKEIFARRIHTIRHGAQAPFVAINCGTLSEGLIESELFGHNVGAFTGADRDFPGAFERADGGTVFLDEVGELRLDLQMNLARILEESSVRRLGGVRQIPFKASVLASTHRDLERMVGEGKFREDLYYRLNVVRLNLPPLRERREDIPLLLNHFFKQARQAYNRPELHVTDDTVEALRQHSFPGNVRELQNIVIKAASAIQEDEVTPQHLAQLINRVEYQQPEAVVAKPAVPASSETPPPSLPILADTDELQQACDEAVIEVERGFLEYWHRKCGGNFSEIARRTRLSRSQLYKMARRTGFKRFDE